MKTIDVSQLYAATGQAKLADLPAYEARIKELVQPGEDVTLTGPGPVWLYLRLAHLLHGRARILTYESPVTGPVVIFNHNPH
ncbi:MAG: CRISPR-associated protein Csx3 [Verrucomicrobiia bacterium]